ncbi:alanine racemase [Mesorhizobium sp.]|uniref:alanine racemase n=1 Tax=Mesorhizobium sp. TaxID=1871066 RepID=UPI0011F9B8F2|nr:alanine racemase [Mesorhizobium sp.]TIN74043.1 MAG: alanine racemase [Mesorhizobium sp.]TIO64653.1 MAG: alanine racemase [Mesorhizobium sp.]TJV87969.1 MAG: alanine racemase [Mesorhizobium sp.]
MLGKQCPPFRSPDAVLEVNLAALRSNFETIATFVGPRVEVSAVVKGDAYGLGLEMVSKALAEAGCRVFFVGSINDAMNLRFILKSQTIAVFEGMPQRSPDIYSRFGLTPVVNNREDLDFIESVKSLPYFLNVDTGFSRSGLNMEELREECLVRTFQRCPPEVIFSHLACAGYASDVTNALQRDRFQSIYNLLRPARGSLAASAGAWLDKSYHFDMVRAGSALYGLNTTCVRPNPFQSVVNLRAKILEVRNVPDKEAVGYDATYRTARDSRMAIVGIGYKHGVPWACSNKISVLCAGRPAAQVGSIMMESMVIDVTDIAEVDCQPGTFVEILHRDFTVDDLAEVAHACPHEVLIHMGASCFRKYLIYPA